jgi:hypothetical protein
MLFQALAVVLPRLAVDARRRVSLQRVVRSAFCRRRLLVQRLGQQAS